jgi:hypothetical protein
MPLSANGNQSDVSPSPNRPWYRHMGSTIAIVLGLVYFVGSFTPSSPSNDGSLPGLLWCLGRSLTVRQKGVHWAKPQQAWLGRS